MSELKKFCQDMLDCINSEIRPDWFSEDDGLCFNAYLYDSEFNTKISDELENIFGEDEFPFNGISSSYHSETINLTLYKNPKRLAFLETNASLPNRFRSVGDLVSVEHDDQIINGQITDEMNHDLAGKLYQVLFDNDAKTHLYFGAKHVLDRKVNV